ncbi:MAG: oligosaccharide flippase family protein [Verrucomicrobiota bacterium]
MRKIRDGTWLVFGRAAGILAPFLVTPLAARVLSKEELGVWALIQVVTGFAAIFQDGGLGHYVIRHASYNREMRSMVRLCGLLVGVFVGLAVVAISVPITFALDIGGYWDLLIPMSGVYAFGGLSGILAAELRRRTLFKRLFVATAIPALLAAAASIFLLWGNFGLWTFPIAALLSAAGQLLILLVSTERTSLRWEGKLVREIVGYTRGLIGFDLVNYWARKLDDVLIGRFIGTSGLAIYANAYRLMMLPINQVISVLNPLILPYMAEKRNDLAACRMELFGFLRVIGVLAFPPMTFLWLERELIIRLYLGPGWEEVSDILVWFAPLGMLQCMVNPLGNCYLITGRNDRFFWMGVANTVIVVTGFLCGLPFGVVGVAVGYFIANLIMLVPNVHVALRTLEGGFIAWLRHTWILWLIPLVGSASILVRDEFLPLGKVLLSTFVTGGMGLILLRKWYAGEIKQLMNFGIGRLQRWRAK